jgi:cytochrome c
MLRPWLIAGIAFAVSTGPTLAQEAAAGEQVFKRLCSPCHDIGQAAKIKLGPPLNGIDSRKSGTFEGFNYSPANKSSGITWSEETFPKYIRAPMQEMPGTRMAFVGIKNDKDIDKEQKTVAFTILLRSHLGCCCAKNFDKAQNIELTTRWRTRRQATSPTRIRCS